jgi:RNA polymerase sigma factor (sigma-70 family)
LADKPSFVEWIARVQAGDEEAVRRLYEEYGGHIVRAVRRRLNQRLRSKFDSLDFVQDVWASFFAEAARRYPLKTAEELIRLLTTMARNKVVDGVRAGMKRKKRDLQRERSLEGEVGGGDRLAGTQPTPSQIVMGREAWDQLLAGQPPVYKRILLLLREGRAADKIAEELGVSTKTVQRIIRKVHASRH